jgi:hypothetical protein
MKIYMVMREFNSCPSDYSDEFIAAFEMKEDAINKVKEMASKSHYLQYEENSDGFSFDGVPTKETHGFYFDGKGTPVYLRQIEDCGEYVNFYVREETVQ